MKLSPRKTQDWIAFLRKELMDLVLYFAALDRRISEREAQWAKFRAEKNK
jgi:hypothetical protein